MEVCYGLLIDNFYCIETINGLRCRGHGIQVSKKLLESAYSDSQKVLDQLKHNFRGSYRWRKPKPAWKNMGRMKSPRKNARPGICAYGINVKNPLVILLVLLGVISFLTGDMRATIMILLMVVLGIVLRYVQESAADTAAEKLQAMVSTTATVIRDGKRQEISLKELVPGDVVTLSAGDMVPADVRVLSSKDLFLNQSTLTGEALPVEKTHAAVDPVHHQPARDVEFVLPGFQR